MVDSGLKPDNQDVEHFNSLKMKKECRCLLYSITDKNSLELKLKGDLEFKFESLKDHLPKDECRYVVYDFDYETDEKPSRKTSKLILIFWAPDVAPIKKKFTFSSAKDAIKKLFSGTQKDFQASDHSQVEFDYIRKELLKA